MRTERKPNRWEELNRENDRVLIEGLDIKVKRSLYCQLTAHRRPAAHVKGMAFAMLGQPRRGERGYTTWLAINAYVEAVAAGREGPPPAA